MLLKTGDEGGRSVRVVVKRVQSVALLGLDVEQVIAVGETLLKVFTNGRWWYPGFRMGHLSELQQEVSIKGIGFGPPQLHPGEVFRLGWVDDTDDKARRIQMPCQRQPVGTGGFQHHQRLLGWSQGAEVLGQLLVGGGCLLNLQVSGRPVGGSLPGNGGALGRNVDPNVEAIHVL